jgi:hypothetical protein
MPRSTFLSGKDAVMRYFQDGTELATLNAKTWECGPKATEFADGVNGERRDRVGAQTDYYEITLELWVDNLDQIDVLLVDRDNEDARVVPLDKSALMQIFPRDGSQKAYAFLDVVVKDWRIKQGGRKERMLVSVNLLATDMKKIPTV